MAGEDAVSPPPSGGDITRQLLAWSAGDQRAAAPAFAALYATLRRLAGRALSGERPDHTLGTAGLIGEAFFRLLEQQHVQWRSREHFLATAAQMMRRILIDHARGRATAKRGHGVAPVPLIEDELVPADSIDGLVAIRCCSGASRGWPAWRRCRAATPRPRRCSTRPWRSTTARRAATRARRAATSC